MSDSRPDPETLLHRAKLEEGRGDRGKLKIFLGAAPGVGKTYAMLEEARKLSSQHVDVAVGYIEPHVRPETAALILGLELLPPRIVEYRNMKLRELDVDAALRRRPTLLLVDELAHSNAPGSRHLKRWQDVEELLEAGIGVYTTLNVQHVESLKDIVARITGVTVRESVPDAFLDGADEIELVDIAPDELLERLRAGKVYVPQEAERAISNFFCKENLIALRELALRGAAERVNAELEDYRKAHDERPVWSTSERLLVCVGPSPFSSKLVRATRRMAASLKAPWLAAHVERPGSGPLTDAAKNQLSQNLRLAEELGAEVVRIGGENVAAAVVEYARQRNVTKIVVGKPLQPRWKEAIFGSFVYELTRRCGEIDVYVISGDSERPTPPAVRSRSRRWSYASLAWAISIVAVTTGVSFALFPFFAPPNLVLVYLLGVVAVAAIRGEHTAALLTSVLSVLAFNFFFVEPRYSFSVTDVQYIFTFFAMFGAGLLISGLTVRLRLQAEWARRREGVSSALYALSRGLAAAQGLESIVEEAARHLSRVFDARVGVLLRDDAGRIVSQDLGPLGFSPDEREVAVGAWVAEHMQPAGRGTSTLPSATALWHPLRASGGSVGALGIVPAGSAAQLDPERVHLLETFANQVALAIERARLAARARASEMEVETERLRNALLSAVSHDLRTPLASIL
ncbi:MAG TPA: sensor histidine kinase KdpD, partial [Planctomycetota bacterium]|nr:sensor histidine kinase KdpD [Planctomycetota bacterium]